MRPALWRRISRFSIAAGLIAAALLVCLRLPHVTNATLALLMLLCIVDVATLWGRPEAWTATIAAVLALDYFLRARGLSIPNFETGVTLAAFFIAAVLIGELAVRAKRRRMEAEQRHGEIEKLYQLSNALLGGGSADATSSEMAEKVAAIFAAAGVALYDKHRGQIFRAGPRAGSLSDQALHEAAAFGRALGDGGSTFAVLPVQNGGELTGSIGISGVQLSRGALDALAGRIGLGLARLHSIEQATEAEAVRRSEELKSAVLDALAHEIRTPLNSVKLAATTLLAEHTGTPLHAREMLAIIDEEADRMDRIIDESMQVARMEASEISLNKEPHNLAPLISAAVAAMGARAGRRAIQVSVQESLPPTECDRGMMLRVLKQLLNNALKYSPEDAPLRISAELTGAAVVIDVVDGGPGVAEDERERIFEKYYRGRAAGSGAPGTGLGLASAKCIVEAHGGAIWVTGAPGGGAAFHVSLPATPAGYPVGAR